MPFVSQGEYVGTIDPNKIPHDSQEGERPSSSTPGMDSRLAETLSQLDIDIPGMVVLSTKEERERERTVQDQKAQVQYSASINRSEATEDLLGFMNDPVAPAIPTAPTQQPAQSPLNTSLQNQFFEKGWKYLLGLLVSKGMINAEQEQTVIAYAGSHSISIGDALQVLDIITEENLGTFIATAYKVPFSRMSVLRVNPQVVQLVSPADALKYQILPVSRIGHTLNVATVNPFENTVLERLRNESEYEVKCIVCTAQTFVNTYNAVYPQQ